MSGKQEHQAAKRANPKTSPPHAKLTLLRRPRKERQQRRAALVAALFDMCPVSAITISLVRDHLRRFRDDLIEERHLVAEAQPFGVFLPADEVRFP